MIPFLNPKPSPRDRQGFNVLLPMAPNHFEYMSLSFPQILMSITTLQVKGKGLMRTYFVLGRKISRGRYGKGGSGANNTSLAEVCLFVCHIVSFCHQTNGAEPGWDFLTLFFPVFLENWQRDTNSQPLKTRFCTGFFFIFLLLCDTDNSLQSLLIGCLWDFFYQVVYGMVRARRRRTFKREREEPSEKVAHRYIAIILCSLDVEILVG